jgi:predicted nucleic acid-binding protein
MASQVVADSGIFLATVLAESLSEKADQLLQQWDQQQLQVAAPVLLQYEIIAVMRKHVYREVLTAAEAAAKRDVLLMVARTIRFEVDEELLRRAYDSQYLALAERFGCDFWTADERLYNAVYQDLPWVHWLGHFKMVPPGKQRENA